MCGIAGMVTRPGEPVDEPVLRKMTDVIHRRGPDADGLYATENVGLGHRRLSIIDTSSGANHPLFNEDGTVGVVFNGEIYNFQSLVAELTARGHHFRTHSDTEVIVHAWEEYGPASVERFRGMFAFALYDSRRGQLFLARDRMGKKPLYYTSTPDRFAYGSEIKALLRVPGLDRTLDLAALGEYATYGNSLGERTIFRHVRKLLPGHSLLLDTKAPGLTPEIRCYWRMKFEPDHGPSEAEWLERLDALLSESVRLRLISDVPLGAFLSGGIDSSLVVAYMTKHSTSRVKTFTIGFKEATHDESRHAEAVARHLGTDHHVEYVRPDALEVLPDLVEAYDEPFVDPSALPTYYLSKMTRRQVTVALSGDGGDELFCGYGRYPLAYATDRLGALITPVGRTVARWGAGLMPWGSRPRSVLEKLSLRGFDLYNHVMGHSGDNLSLLRPEVRQLLPNAAGEKMARDFNRFPELSLREKYQYLDIMNYLPDDILVKVDRAAMYHSLEVRCPILDHEVVEMSARIPLRLKLSGLSGKKLLKKLAYKYVPREVLDRPKMGFGVPLAAWFRGELVGVLRDMVADTASPMWNYFDRDAAARRVQEHQARRADLSLTLWRLLFFHRWCDHYMR